MTIVLYTSTAEERVLNKSGYLTQVSTLTGTLRSGTNLVDPSIIIELDTLPNFNYVYIQDFNRYYFVRDINNLNNKLWEIKLHCDVLFSHMNDILNLECDIGRNEYNYNLLLDDTKRVMTNKYNLQIIETPNAELYFDLPSEEEPDSDMRYLLVGLA